jgi:hypothetical protein
MVARAVAEEEFADDRSRELFEQDTFDKLLKEARLLPPTLTERPNSRCADHGFTLPDPPKRGWLKGKSVI